MEYLINGCSSNSLMLPALSSSQPLWMGACSFLCTPIHNGSSGSRNHPLMTLSTLSNMNLKSHSSSASSKGPMNLSPRVHRLLFSTIARLSSIAAITLLSSPFLKNALQMPSPRIFPVSAKQLRSLHCRCRSSPSQSRCETRS